jgi:hypothetical protein
MDVTSIASLATSLTQAETGQAVSTAVLKKAMDISASSASALVEALPPPISPNLPPNLGRNINTTA